MLIFWITRGLYTEKMTSRVGGASNPPQPRQHPACRSAQGVSLRIVKLDRTVAQFVQPFRFQISIRQGLVNPKHGSMRMLERIDDKRPLNLINQWLKARINEPGCCYHKLVNMNKKMAHPVSKRD